MLRRRLIDALCRAGVVDPVVSVEIVDSLERNQHTGKLRRFIALASADRS